MAAWSDHEGVTPDATPEPFPLEVWTFFTDADLDQLVVDACAELGRREMARRSA